MSLRTRRFLKLILACGPFLCGSVSAESVDNLPDHSEPEIKPLAILDEPQEAISKRIIRFANWLDSFFGEPRIFEEIPENYLQMNFQSLAQDHRSPRYRAEFRGKITLPHTEERLKLLIESEPEDEDPAAAPESPAQALESQQQSVGLRYLNVPTEQWRINTDAGVRLRTSPDPFVRLRLRRLYALKKWNLRAAETLFWYDSSGTGSTTQLDLERVLNSKFFFRATSLATWLEETGYFNLSQEFALYHNLDSRRVLSYQVVTSGISRPEPHVTNHLLSVRLRQQIHRDWLFMEINPQVNFPRDQQFHAVKSISFKLEFLFGSY